MALSNYLVRRGKRGIWQLRVPVPRAHRGRHGGPAEKTVSLKTSDRALATQRALQILPVWQASWAAAAQPPHSIHRTGEAFSEFKDRVALAAFENLAPNLRETRREAAASAQAYEENVAQRARAKAKLNRLFQAGDFRSPKLEAFARRWIKLENRPELDGPEFQELMDDLTKSVIEALNVLEREDAGEIGVEPASETLRLAKKRQAQLAKPGERIADLYDAYVSWRTQPGRKSRRRPEAFAQDWVAVDLFIEFVGRDRAVGSITKDDARAFRRMLARFPASRAKRRELTGASIDQCVEIAERLNLPRLSLTTQAKYLSIISPFLDWLVSDGPVALPENIFSGLHHKLERGVNRRPSFSAEELIRIFRSPLFNACAGDTKEHEPGEIKVRDWRFWIPILCLATGARITEIAQLRLQDVEENDGVTLIRLRHDESTGQRQKGKRTRIAALHPLIAGNGFLDYWQGKKRRGSNCDIDPLFPELSGGKRDLIGAEPARFFRRYLQRIGIKSGADQRGIHSFRHTMADALRSAGFMDAEYGELVLGHSNRTVTSLYGALTQGTPQRLLRMILAAFDAKPLKELLAADNTSLFKAS